MKSTSFVVVGLSHHTAPIELRERLALPADQAARELETLRERCHLDEALVVSTCNRVEVYGVSSAPTEALTRLRERFIERAASPNVQQSLYERWGSEAIRHTFRVAASLDSMVVGEPQILGQVKEALSLATMAGSVGTLLGRCFEQAFSVAKRVRGETAIAAGTVSVSSIACELAEKIFSSLEGRSVLLIGAGKMGENAAKRLARSGARLVVVNRSPARAAEVARACGGEARGIEQLSTELLHADVAISSTNSDRFIVTPEIMHEVIRGRKRRPIFLIDIAVPRDVDPRVGSMENVFLYDVDDLEKVAHENLAARRRAAGEAETIVERETAAFEHWLGTLAMTPTLVALRERFRSVVHDEVERTLGRLQHLDPKERDALKAMAESIVNKLLHRPLTELKNHAQHTQGTQLIEAARRLFDLPNPSALPPAMTQETPSLSPSASPLNPGESKIHSRPFDEAPALAPLGERKGKV